MRDILEFGLIYRFDFSVAFVVPGYVIVVAAGYLLGSLNAAIIISRLAFRDDIRNHGSGGAGMTNMQRTYGNLAGIVTFVCDGLKTVIAVFIGMIFFGSDFYLTAVYAGPYVGGLAAVVGHAFPVYYKFKGGKSVAAAFFMALVTAPFVALASFAIFAAIVIGTKYISLGSIMAVMIYPLILNRITGLGLHNLMAIAVMFIVVLRHRENIKRLGAGQENKISLRKKKDKKEDKKEDKGG